MDYCPISILTTLLSAVVHPRCGSLSVDLISINVINNPDLCCVFFSCCFPVSRGCHVCLCVGFEGATRRFKGSSGSALSRPMRARRSELFSTSSLLLIRGVRASALCYIGVVVGCCCLLFSCLAK